METIFKYLDLRIMLRDTAPPYNLIMMGVKEK
jgi:hypothetical protein